MNSLSDLDNLSCPLSMYLLIYYIIPYIIGFIVVLLIIAAAIIYDKGNPNNSIGIIDSYGNSIVNKNFFIYINSSFYILIIIL